MIKELSLSELSEQLRKTQLGLLDWQNEGINFVPLRGSWHANSEKDFDLEQEINNFLTSNKKVLLLMGDSGAGKSLYTQGLAIKLCKNVNAQAPIPLWISLPSLKDPVNSAIEETFETHGFNAKQIEQLRKTKSFIFILDAYDEIRTLKNLYATNHLEQWNAKIIITCRREYLYNVDNFKLYFVPFYKEKAEYASYNEMIIRPFNTNQITQYLQQYIQSQDPLWKDIKRYEQAIDDIPGLKNLIKTPFILRLTMEVLPQVVEHYQDQASLQRRQLTQAALYDIFIEQWFIRQEQKLKTSGQISEEEDIKPEFWTYAKELAQTMHEQGVTQIEYANEEESDLFGETKATSPWESFFNSKDKRVALLQTACLIRKIGNKQYTFIHASLGEYFLTRNLYEQLTGIVSLTKEEELVNTTSETSNLPSLTVSTNVPTRWQQEYLNQQLLVKEYNKIQLLADRVGNEAEFEKTLFERIYASKNNPTMKIAAANAITILNRARVPFSGMDLSGIQIPEADLSYSIMDFTNLSDTDLTKVTIKDSFLNNVNMTNAKMQEINFGQLPSLHYQDSVAAICFSPYKKYLAVATGNNVFIYQPDLKKKYAHFVGQTGTSYDYYDALCGRSDAIISMAFSLDGKLFVTGNENGSVQLWDIENKKLSGKPMKRLGSDATACSIAFSSDGIFIAVGYRDGYICLWDTSTKEIFSVISYQHNRYTKIVLSLDDKLLISGSHDHSVRVWDIEKKLEVGVVPQGNELGKVNSVAIAPDGKLIAACGRGGSINLWDTKTLELVGNPLKANDAPINCITFSPDGLVLASGGDDWKVRLWDTRIKVVLGEFAGHLGEVNCLAFTFDGNLLASGGKDSGVRLWDYRARREERQFFDKFEDDLALFSKKGGFYASVSRNRTLRFWNLTDKVPYLQKIVHTKAIKSLAFSHDDKLLVTGSTDGTIGLFDIEEKVLSEPFQVATFQWVLSLAFNQNGTLLAVVIGGEAESYNYSVVIYAIKNKRIVSDPVVTINTGFIEKKKPEKDATSEIIGTVTRTLENFTNGLSNVSFSPNGKLLAFVGMDKNVISLWDITTHSLFGKFPEVHKRPINSLDFTPDGKILASGSSDKTIQMWDLKSLKPIGLPLKGHSSDVNSVTFSPDGKLLVSGSYDGTIQLRKVGNENEVQVLYEGIYPINNISFSPDGNHIVSGLENAIVLLKRQNSITQPNLFFLVWYSAECYLSLDRSIIKGATEVSPNNYRLLAQHGAIIENQVKDEDIIEPVYSDEQRQQSSAVTLDQLLHGKSAQPAEPRRIVTFEEFLAREARHQGSLGNQVEHTDTHKNTKPKGKLFNKLFYSLAHYINPNSTSKLKKDISTTNNKIDEEIENTNDNTQEKEEYRMLSEPDAVSNLPSLVIKQQPKAELSREKPGILKSHRGKLPPLPPKPKEVTSIGVPKQSDISTPTLTAKLATKAMLFALKSAELKPVVKLVPKQINPKNTTVPKNSIEANKNSAQRKF